MDAALWQRGHARSSRRGLHWPPSLRGCLLAWLRRAQEAIFLRLGADPAADGEKALTSHPEAAVIGGGRQGTGLPLKKCHSRCPPGHVLRAEGAR